MESDSKGPRAVNVPALSYTDYQRGRFGGRGRGGCFARSAGVICLIVSSPLASCWRISASFSRRFCCARSIGVATCRQGVRRRPTSRAWALASAARRASSR
jgi:hypothetical protein